MIHAVTIILPWWLKWSKRFVKLKHETLSLPNKLRGIEIDTVIIDEIVTKEEADKLANKKLRRELK